MGFKKHNWINYGNSGDIVRIEIMDSSGKKIDHFQCNNKKDYASILKIVKDKYGFSPEVEIDKQVAFNKEKDWLKSDFEL